MTASKREQAKGEARMRCSGSRAGDGCEARMRRTWWSRPTAGLRGAGESGSQCIKGGVDAWTSKTLTHHPALSWRCCGANAITAEGGVALAWGSETRDPEPTKTMLCSNQSESPIANCQLPNGQTAGQTRRCGVERTFLEMPPVRSPKAYERREITVIVWWVLLGARCWAAGCYSRLLGAVV